MQIKDYQTLELLYHEAKENIIDGRYPLKGKENYDELAGIQALLQFGTFNESTHTPTFFK